MTRKLNGNYHSETVQSEMLERPYAPEIKCVKAQLEIILNNVYIWEIIAPPKHVQCEMLIVCECLHDIPNNSLQYSIVDKVCILEGDSLI